MPVNKDELAQDIATNPEYQTIVKTELAKKEFVIHDKTEHTAYLDRVKSTTIEQELPKQLDAKISETYSRIDKDVKELYGIDRNTNEKTHEYLKRAAKTRNDELASSKATIIELNEAIKKGDPTGVWSKKLEETQQLYQSQLAAKDQEIEGVRKQAGGLATKAKIDLTFVDIKKDFKKALPPMFDITQEAILSSVSSQVKTGEDGQLYMIDAAGAWVLDGTFSKVPLTNYLRDKFKDVIEIKKIVPGSGSHQEPPPDIDPTKLTLETFPMKPSIKTKPELMDYMNSIGLKRGTTEYNRIWGKFSVNLATV